MARLGPAAGSVARHAGPPRRMHAETHMPRRSVPAAPIPPKVADPRRHRAWYALDGIGSQMSTSAAAPLHAAVIAGDEIACRQLLAAAPVLVQATDERGLLPLHVGAYNST